MTGEHRWGQLMRRAAQGLRAAGDEDPFAAQAPGSQDPDLEDVGAEDVGPQDPGPQTSGPESSGSQGPEPDRVHDQEGAEQHAPGEPEAADPGVPLPQRDPDRSAAPHRPVPPAQRPDDHVLDHVAQTLRRL